MDALLADLRFAIRTLRRSPGYTLAALLTLMLGIGATTAVFSVVHGIVLAPLPFVEPDRLVVGREENGTGRPMDVAWRNFTDWRASARGFEALAAHSDGWPQTVLGAGDPLRVDVSAVSEGFLRTLGVQPAVGRDFLPDEHRLGADPAAIVSDGFWRTVLGGEPDLSARRLTVGAHDVRIIGVLPPGVAYPEGADVWVPLELSAQSEHRTAHNYTVIGRLRAGTVAAAEAELDAITRTFLDENPSVVTEEGFEGYFPRGAQLRSLHDTLVGDTRRPLWILLGAAALVLLVSCTNLASATLARATGREREYAVRRSLGAGRGRLIRQLFTESLVLALAGAVLAVAFAAGALRLLPVLAPAGIPRIDEVGLDATVLGTALLVTLLTAVLFGLLPAMRFGDGSFSSVVRGGRGGIDRGRHRVWKTLIAAEVAFALVLLVGAGLLIRSFLTVMSVEAGFRTTGLLTATVSPPSLRYGDDASKRRYYDELLRELVTLPGVATVGLISSPPMESVSNGLVDVQGGPEPTMTGDYQLVGGEYFRATGIPLLRGRLFDARDHAASPDVAIVNRTFAERVWPGEDPVGKQITGGGMDNYGGRDRWATVVGVVGDSRQRDLTAEPRPTYYFLTGQRPFRAWSMTAVLQPERGSAALLASAVRAAATRVGPDVPVAIATIEARMAEALTPRRFTVLVLGVFAAAALALACVGIWGVVAYAVARRTREIGIRIALGADAASVRRLVQRDYLQPVALGVIAGLVLSLWLTRVLQGLLYEVPATDPPTFIAVAFVLGAAAWLASFVPALRGTRVTPMETMRTE